jgi:two-component system LytT family sensor kinase
LRLAETKTLPLPFMDIFRQDKIELTRSDYQMIGAYILVMWLWLGYKFYVEDIGLVEAILDIIIQTIKVLSGFFALKFLLEFFILQRKQWLLGIGSILFAFITIGCTIIVFGNFTAGISPLEVMFPLSNFIVLGFNTVLFDIALFIGFVFSKKSYDQFINNKNLAIENRENALKILRAQFSPHFLFNNLNTIDALIDDQPGVAKKYVSHLASLYRYLTETVNQGVMLLEKELSFIRDYLFLIKVRYGEDYLFDIRVEQPTDSRFLPSGALQTALENVVKHNAIDGRQIMTTLLVAEETVTISNSKGGQGEASASGTGLKNLATRYELLGAPSLEIENLPHQYTLRLPLLRAWPE